MLPDVVAHRGASAHRAEHTLAAYALAIEQGADGLECDVRLSRDFRIPFRPYFERMKWILSLSLPFYVLDQLTKHWILQHVSPQTPHLIIPGWFALVHVTNTGAAFGSFQNNNLFFIAISVIAVVAVLSQLLRRKRRPDAWRDVSLALLLAGVLGNLTDRLLHGHVIDFLLFDLHVPLARPWPAFNVADSCICVAVFCFVVYSLHAKPQPGNNSKTLVSNDSPSAADRP